jgi:hypothetical protein
VAADDKRLQALLDQFAPRTRDIVLQTPIAADIERLEFLLALTPQNQSDVARRLDMEWTWDDAVKLLPEPSSREGVERVDVPDESGPHPTETTDIANVLKTNVVVGEAAEQLADIKARPDSSDQARQVVQVRLGELRPNPINERIFSDSLEDLQLRDLADHLARYGQREPIIVDSSLMILSGERRWRALRLIGANYACVVVDAVQRSADELEDLVLDDFSLKRKPSLAEQVKVYDAYVRSFTRRYGRGTGRPRKADKILSGSWDSNRVHEEAAAAAGLGSRETARQAEWVTKHGDTETRAAMLSRGMSIHAAYALLHQPGDDEAQTKDTKPPPQLPSGSSEHSSSAAPLPSNIEDGLPRGSAPTEAVAPGSGEPPSSGFAASATAGGSGSPTARDTRASAGAVPPERATGAGASNHTPPGESATGLNRPSPESKPTARTKAKAATKREQSPDRRSFDCGMAAAERYVCAVLERDEPEALRLRDEGIAILNAAVDGQCGAEVSAGDLEDGDEDAAAKDPTLDGGAQGHSDEDFAPEVGEVDLTVWPEEDGEEPSTKIEPAEHADGDQEEAASGAAEDDDEDGDPGKASDEEYDYSDYCEDDDDDDDDDESDDERDDTDDEDLTDSEDDDYQNEEHDEDDELKDPMDAEVDSLLGRLRARRI